MEDLAKLHGNMNSISLASMQDFSVDPKTKELIMRVGWGPEVDLDASAALLDPYFYVVDQVWWKHLKSKCKSVEHSGDDRLGEDKADSERIKIHLESVPYNVYHILLAINVHSNSVSFQQVQKAYVRLFEYITESREKDLCSFSFSDMKGDAMLMGVLSRRGQSWSFKALGTPASGNNIQEIAEHHNNIQSLQNLPVFRPGKRHIALEVVRGKNLAAKDAGIGVIRRASSDPYFVIKYEEEKFQSPHVSQNLNPRWPPNSFILGNIKECEEKKFSLEIFDYDLVSADDFMGCIRIPAGYLYSKGIGLHEEWFTLGQSEKPEFANEEVSGEILLRFKNSPPEKSESVMSESKVS